MAQETYSDDFENFDWAELSKIEQDHQNANTNHLRNNVTNKNINVEIIVNNNQNAKPLATNITRLETVRNKYKQDFRQCYKKLQEQKTITETMTRDHNKEILWLRSELSEYKQLYNNEKKKNSSHITGSKTNRKRTYQETNISNDGELDETENGVDIKRMKTESQHSEISNSNNSEEQKSNDVNIRQETRELMSRSVSGHSPMVQVTRVSRRRRCRNRIKTPIVQSTRVSRKRRGAIRIKTNSPRSSSEEALDIDNEFVTSSIPAVIPADAPYIVEDEDIEKSDADDHDSEKDSRSSISLTSFQYKESVREEALDLMPVASTIQ